MSLPLPFLLTARLIAVVCAVLFVILCFVPQAYAPTYGVTADEGVQFLTRRAAPMFIAPAIILWIAAAAPRTPLRDGIAGAVALMFIVIAVTGVSSWAQGTATASILVAAVLECLIAAALWFTRKN